jgi:hypothetical protein
MQRKGHEVLVTASNKEISYRLLDGYGIDYKRLGSYGTTLGQKLANIPLLDIKMYDAVKSFKPDIFLGFGSQRNAHVSRLLRKRCIAFEDSEPSVDFILYVPFTDAVLTPTCFKKDLGKRQIRYNGYTELAYLHPKYFTPDPSVLGEIGVDKNEEYVLMRYVGWKAGHDVGHGGFDFKSKLAAVKGYVSTEGIPEAALLKMAKFGAVIDAWMKETDVAISAVQCWTSMEEYFGVVPCTIMSMMSNNLIPSACEVDVCGAIGMYALTLASETPSALLDWNNNYGDDPDKAVCFHCSNLPKHFFQDVRMDYQEIIAGTVGKANTFGTCVGRVKPGPMSFARFSTDDLKGSITGYLGEGEFTDDPLNTFGGAGVVRIPEMQKLLRYICENGFEHHVAANLSQVSGMVYEAATRYLGWDIYYHR